MTWYLYFLAVPFVVGYLLGSIPFGLLLTRAAGLGDIRQQGSGNIGATNVLRTGRKGLAAATLIGDMLKGTAAVLIMRKIGGIDPALAAGFAAVLGHVFPVWLKFKGGKGVATFLGTLLGVAWPAGLAFAVIWLGCAALFRYSSLSALVASAASPLVLLGLGRADAALVFLMLTILLFWRHRKNIEKLRAGTEGRIGANG